MKRLMDRAMDYMLLTLQGCGYLSQSILYCSCRALKCNRTPFLVCHHRWVPPHTTLGCTFKFIFCTENFLMCFFSLFWIIHPHLCPHISVPMSASSVRRKCTRWIPGHISGPSSGNCALSINFTYYELLNFSCTWWPMNTLSQFSLNSFAITVQKTTSFLKCC